jgi:hypothetical protein
MKKPTFGEKAIDFYKNIEIPQEQTNGVSFMNPYKDDVVQNILKQFFTKFFDDNKKRTFLIGINPGRFGGGLTGIAFTDPINLEEKCGIKNNIPKKPELSSKFIYRLIDEYGGVEQFYSDFFITAIYPFALIKEGKNYNYYDSKRIYEKLKPDIIQHLQSQIDFGAYSNKAICLGKKNEKYLHDINNELNFFEEIITVDHPRYIMQYKLKKIDEYIEYYLDSLNRE